MKSLLLALSVILLFVETGAQTSISSPYSALGLGNISNVNNIRNRAMGGIGIGVRDNSTVNYFNAASYTSIDTTSFVFGGGIVGNYTEFKTNSISEDFSAISLSHLLFGFPVTKWWKSSIGLIPFSNVGYNVVDEDYNDVLGTTQHVFEGSGGLSRFYWGNAIKPLKFLSIGINASYLFGTIDRTQYVSFPDSAYFVSSKTTSSLTIKDVYLDLGIQYFTNLKDDLSLVVGATFNPKINLGANKTFLSQTYYGYLTTIENFKDTVLYEPEKKGTVLMPMGFGIGFTLQQKGKWTIGADYKFDKWADFEIFGVNDSLVNSHTLSLGGEYIPNINSITSYLQRINYRLGGKYAKSNLELRNEHIDNFGITFGFGLPLRSLAVRGTKSMINLGFEVGRRGTLTNDLIQENYATFYVGISIYELWFIKRRYR
ncbi:MAG: hypothetical protein JW731_14765 [Bacteroidales bacterium]|nr:hypothetical protein [Bacteroidales bacterium]